MEEVSKEKKRGRIYAFALCSGLFVFLLLLGIIIFYLNQNKKAQSLHMEYIARTIEADTYEVLLSQMAKCQVLEAYLIETGGSFDTFAPIAEGLLEDKVIRSLIFAPESIVRGIYPTEGNEPVMGLDLTSNGLGNREAVAAIEKGDLFLAGPFELVEGGMGVCGRLPVYLENEQGEKDYWGLVCLTLNYPDLFQNNPIWHIRDQGFAGEIWRINPDDGLKQVILETQGGIPQDASAEDYQISMFHAQWILSLAPLPKWYNKAGAYLCFLGSVLAGVLVGFATYITGTLQRVKAEETVRKIHDLQRQLELEQTNNLLGQISSHFFYHTLNALQALILLKPSAAYKMAEDFSKYLRFNIDAITVYGGLVSFKRELRAVRAYAEINEEQLGDRLRVLFCVPDVDFDIPVLTLQPIVENAILHGIKPKVHGGTVTISLKEREDAWEVTVEDDGVGFDTALPQKEESIGMKNVKKRISGYAGCSMHVESHPGVGTKVILIYQKKLKK
ncbi:MAG: histidine kinase [Eubacteriales bacterium]|nr:histidine kinase [Eubacteriales bacterium]